MSAKNVLNHSQTLRVFEPQKTFYKDVKALMPFDKGLPEILCITSYPPRECGIATYSQDLIAALNNQFNRSFKIGICPLESNNEKHHYKEKVKYILNTDQPNAFQRLARSINEDERICMIMIQHEFGFFDQKEELFQQFLDSLAKPVVIAFHTVLPQPDQILRLKVQQIARASESVVVMTQSSANILTRDYGLTAPKISVIPHGTHLVEHLDKEALKEKYGLAGKKVLSTFGLLSSGKNIETTLEALPAIVERRPDTMFLIIGKTHPSVAKQEGEQYRQFLKDKIAELQLEPYVQFVNYFLPLPDLLEYLQLTDIYLFTSKDPHQAVSGTFSYALSCGCPIISTPIPHALEVLQNDAGIIIDFENPKQLSRTVVQLLDDDRLRKEISLNAMHRMAPTAWENAAIAHSQLFERLSEGHIYLRYNLPAVNLNHVKKMTTDFGMIQFSKINQPDIDSGYTLDDNARALVSLCMHYRDTNDEGDLKYIHHYLEFIAFCQQPNGYFFNYVDAEREFTPQNGETNLEDANGRALWALGYLISQGDILPASLVAAAETLLERALPRMESVHSTRAMAFAIKGLYYGNRHHKTPANTKLIKTFANRLVQMYRHHSEPDWRWFEGYLTYANSVLPEALLCAYQETGDLTYRDIAKTTFDFLLSLTFNDQGVKVISNKSWLQKGKQADPYGEQPIDVAYTILALDRFYKVFRTPSYLNKLVSAFNWFLGNNHLHQIIYNPRTGGCYDGLEDDHVNLNQGAESTLSYLMARLVVEKYSQTKAMQGSEGERFAVGR